MAFLFSNTTIASTKQGRPGNKCGPLDFFLSKIVLIKLSNVAVLNYCVKNKPPSPITDHIKS